MKKKILVALLTLTLAISSIACSSQKIEPAKTTNASSETSSEASPNENSGENSTSENTVTIDIDKNISGAINVTTYENKFFQVKIALGDAYRFATEEELQTINSKIAEISGLEDEEATKKALEKGMSVAYAVDAKSNKALNIVLLSVGSVAGALTNEQSFIESQKNETISSLEAQGLTDITSEIQKINFLGEDHLSILSTANMNGSNLYQRQICLIKDGYIIIFAASGLDKEKFDSELLNAEKLAE